MKSIIMKTHRDLYHLACFNETLYRETFNDKLFDLYIHLRETISFEFLPGDWTQ